MSPHRPIKRYTFALLLLPAIFFVLFMSYYRFPSHDQSTQFTSVLHFFDNELYQNDFDMQFINPVSVKMIPHLALFTLSKALRLPLSLIYFIVYVTIIYWIFTLCYLITYRLNGQWISGSLACLLLLLFGRNVLLTGSRFQIITASLTPYFISVPVHLLCFYLVLKKRYLLSVVVSGILFCVHGQISLFTFLSILTVVAFTEKRFRQVMRYFLLYIVLVLPMLIPLVLRLNALVYAAPKYSIQELSLFRVPHHIFLDLLQCAVFAWIMVSILLMLNFGKRKFGREVAYWIYPLMIIFLVGIVFSRFIPVDFVMLMYCLRVDVFLRIFFFVLFSIICCDGIRHMFTKRSLRGHSGPWSVFIGIQIVFLVAAFVAKPAYFELLRRIDRPHQTPSDIYRYIKDNTPKRSLLITPPYYSGFRMRAQRSIVVAFKTNPIGWGGRLQDEWMERLHDVCNVKNFRDTGFRATGECAKGFRKLTRRDFSRLYRKYQADYFVTPARYADNLGEDIFVYSDSELCLFRCPEE